jgi:hypothetical protein
MSVLANQQICNMLDKISPVNKIMDILHNSMNLLKRPLLLIVDAKETVKYKQTPSVYIFL